MGSARLWMCGCYNAATGRQIGADPPTRKWPCYDEREAKREIAYYREDYPTLDGEPARYELLEYRLVSTEPREEPARG